MRDPIYDANYCSRPATLRYGTIDVSASYLHLVLTISFPSQALKSAPRSSFKWKSMNKKLFDPTVYSRFQVFD